MSPTEPGQYKLGHMVYVAEDVKMPYKAQATLQAKVKGDTLSADGIMSCFLDQGLETDVLEMYNDEVVVEVTGELEATYGVRSVAVAERIDD